MMPSIMKLTDDEKRDCMIGAAEATERLNAGEPIEALTDEQVTGQLVMTEALLCATLTEMRRRRAAKLQ